MWSLIVLSLLGGLVLNILPCVLPVLPIKLLSWIRQSEGSWRRRLGLSALYSLGLIFSFALLGAICAVALSAGHYLGFGFQLDNGWFVAFMALIMAGFGLHLLGGLQWAKKALYLPCIERWRALRSSESPTASNEPYEAPKTISDITLKPRYIEAQKRESQEGLLDRSVVWVKRRGSYLKAFGEGCLTTALGSACMGPFIGSAMGLALMLSPWAVFGSFCLIGVGMALPYMLLPLAPVGAIKKASYLNKWTPWVEKGCGALMLLVSAWFIWLLF